MQDQVYSDTHTDDSNNKKLYLCLGIVSMSVSGCVMFALTWHGAQLNSPGFISTALAFLLALSIVLSQTAESLCFKRGGFIGTLAGLTFFLISITAIGWGVSTYVSSVDKHAENHGSTTKELISQLKKIESQIHDHSSSAKKHSNININQLIDSTDRMGRNGFAGDDHLVAKQTQALEAALSLQAKSQATIDNLENRRAELEREITRLQLAEPVSPNSGSQITIGAITISVFALVLAVIASISEVAGATFMWLSRKEGKKGEELVDESELEENEQNLPMWRFQAERKLRHSIGFVWSAFGIIFSPPKVRRYDDRTWVDGIDYQLQNITKLFISIICFVLSIFLWFFTRSWHSLKSYLNKVEPTLDRPSSADSRLPFQANSIQWSFTPTSVDETSLLPSTSVDGRGEQKSISNVDDSTVDRSTDINKSVKKSVDPKVDKRDTTAANLSVLLDNENSSVDAEKLVNLEKMLKELQSRTGSATISTHVVNANSTTWAMKEIAVATEEVTTAFLMGDTLLPSLSRDNVMNFVKIKLQKPIGAKFAKIIQEKSKDLAALIKAVAEGFNTRHELLPSLSQENVMNFVKKELQKQIDEEQAKVIQENAKSLCGIKLQAVAS